MVSLDMLTDEQKARVVSLWKKMSESDKAHFINQVALALSVWGSDERGKDLVVQVLDSMSKNGTKTLADFGLYAQDIDFTDGMPAKDKIRRACIILEGYRVKNALSSEPHRDLV